MLFRVLVLFLLVAPVLAQEFEVATLKLAPVRLGYDGPVEHPTGGPGTADPGMFRCAYCRMAELVTVAFDLQRYQLDLSRFLANEEYEIAAKIPPGTTPVQFRAMLQKLLQERLGLAYHVEKQAAEGYTLVVAKGGPKLKPPTAGQDGVSIKDRLTADGMVRWHFNQTSLGEFARRLAQDSGAPFEDATGLTGLFDIDLRWHGPDGLSLAEAIQQQLGLRMEAKKVPVDVLIVDRLEKKPKN